VTRIRAADDFAANRARMEQLARENAQARAEQDRPAATGPGLSPAVVEGMARRSARSRASAASLR
jgi:hypothetical protein